jgi:medium-chain acyl-[acyl-carrier-protein] hydrolase
MEDKDFVEEIRKLKATPEEILTNPDVLKLLLPVLRADVELCETYEYSPDTPLTCPIIAFAGIDDNDETVARMEEWRLLTSGEFVLHQLNGNHFFIHSNEQELLRLLRVELVRKLSKASPT